MFANDIHSNLVDLNVSNRDKKFCIIKANKISWSLCPWKCLLMTYTLAYFISLSAAMTKSFIT